MKKLISLILVVFMTALVPLSAASEVEPRNIYDVNDDGKVNMFDYVLVKGIYFGTIDTVPEFDAADINGDGVVNVFDCVLLKKAYLASDDDIAAEEKYIPHEAHDLLAGFNDGTDAGIKAKYGATSISHIITDFEQLDSLLDTYLYDSIYAGNGQILAFYDNLPEDYFETKALIIAPICLGSGSIIVAIEGIKVDGTEISMELSLRLYGDGIDEEQCRLMTAEVNKSDIAACETAKAEVIECFTWSDEYTFNGRAPFVEDEELPSRLITTNEQLDELVEACDPLVCAEFIEYANSLPENLFDSKALAVTAVGLPNPGYSVHTSAIIAGRDSIELYFYRWYDNDYCYPDVYVEMIYVHEIAKSDFGDVYDTTASYLN